MKTLYITNLGLLDNLAQTQVLPYLEGLSKKGTEINILSFEKRENLKNPPRIDMVKKKLAETGIRWDYLLYHNRWGNILDILLGFIKAASIVKKRRIDILHARASIPILIAWPVARLFRRRVIYDRRGTMSGDFIDDVNVKNIFSIRAFSGMLEKIDRFLIGHSDATVVLSKRARGILEKDRHISRMGVTIGDIPCAADMPRYDTARRNAKRRPDLREKFIMGYLGSLGTCYLLKEMAAFFRALKKRKKNALFLIISHTGKESIKPVLEREGLAPGKDCLIINLEPEEVPRHIAWCDFSIMFIKPVECKIGSSPTKFGESLAAGIPVIVNRGIGDTEDIIRKSGVGAIVEDFTEDHYDRALNRLEELLGDVGTPGRCVKAAKEYFSLADAITKYDIIYGTISR